jgi:AcrR family transcriptional regulator
MGHTVFEGAFPRPHYKEQEDKIVPTEFTKQEKQRIRDTLITEGRRLFSRYGLKRTAIAELCRAAGIAKGSFYAFFTSKEDLFMAVLDREEEFRHQLLEEIYREAPDTRSAIELLFIRGLKFVEQSEFLQQLYTEETYPQLMRKLGKERLEAHQHKDEQELNGFVTALQQQGLIVQAKPEAVVGLFRSIFLLTLHKREIGEEIFDEVMELTARVVASGLSTGLSTDKGAQE